MKLSIIIPVYNEERWVEDVVKRALAQSVPGISFVELVIVNDGSTDRTPEILERLAREFPANIVVLRHDRNLGKGAAVATAFGIMTGDICIIQDADPEYDPVDYPLLIAPIVTGRADCVYGSRFSGSQPKRVLYFWHYAGNRFLTVLSNVLTNVNLTDMETGFKAFRAQVLRGITIKSRGFDFEPEITARLARRGYRIYEVGINYNGRTYAEGKKVTWLDGLKAVAAIIRYAIFY